MEPNRPGERVSDVWIVREDPVSGELPRIDAAVGRPDRVVDPEPAVARDIEPEVHLDVLDIDLHIDLHIDLAAGFDQFYRTTHGPIARALAVTLRDVDLAADSIDEAFARAYQRWDRVGALDNPGGWVYRVALNHATSRLRQISRRSSTRSPNPVTVEHVEHQYGDPAIGAALANLSTQHRAVVVCRLLLGWSEKDTADALDVRPGTVKSRLSRALDQLQSHLTHLRPEES